MGDQGQELEGRELAECLEGRTIKIVVHVQETVYLHLDDDSTVSFQGVPQLRAEV